MINQEANNGDAGIVIKTSNDEEEILDLTHFTSCTLLPSVHSSFTPILQPLF